MIRRFERQNRTIPLSLLPVAYRKYIKQYRLIMSRKPFNVTDLPEAVRERFNPGGKWLIFLYPRMDRLYTRQKLQELDRLAGKISFSLNGEVRESLAVGSTILSVRFMEIFQRDGKYIVPLTLLLIPAFLLGGLLALLGVKLNFFSAAVLPILVGYGIDNGIFIYYRYSISGDVPLVMGTVGKAVLASGLTSMVGWGSLLFAAHPGIQSIGLTACLGVGVLLLVSLTLLPAGLILFPGNLFRRDTERSVWPAPARSTGLRRFPGRLF